VSRRYAFAAIFFTLATLAFFHAIVLHPGSRLAVDPGAVSRVGFGDGASALRNYWATFAAHKNPFDFTYDRLNGAPQGLVQTPATNLASGGIQSLWMWALHGPLGLIGAWTAFLVFGVLATSLSMFALLDWLGCSLTASIFGGYVFGFNPYIVERVYAGHLGLVQNWVLIVVLAALIRLGSRRSIAAAVLTGAAMAIAFYDSAYQGLLAGLMTIVFCGLEVARRDGRLRSALLCGASFVAAGIGLIPVLVLYAREKAAVDASTGHAAGDLSRFGASLGAYLVPSPRNPLFHWLRGIHPGDLTEETLFVGYTTLVLAAAGFVLLSRRAGWFVESERRLRVTAFAAAVAPAAFLMSLPMRYSVGIVSLPGPSMLTFHITSFWRVYSRFGIVVGLAFAIAAAAALTILGRRSGRGWRLLPFVALGLVVVELLPGNIHTIDAQAEPPWIAWLASAPRGIVATYPVPVGGRPGAAALSETDFWYQRFDGDPRFGPYGLEREARDVGIRLAAANLAEPVAASVLATEGVRYVVVHTDVYRHDGHRVPRIDPARFTRLAQFGPVSIYSVHAPKVNIDAALHAKALEIAAREGLQPLPADYVAGFQAEEPLGLSMGRWLIQDGWLDVDSGRAGEEIMIEGSAFANGKARRLEVEDTTGRILARTTIPTGSVALHLGPFALRAGTTRFVLVARPGAAPISSSDPRPASVFLADLSVMPLPAYVTSSRLPPK
jgi:hypothetical protein